MKSILKSLLCNLELIVLAAAMDPQHGGHWDSCPAYLPVVEVSVREDVTVYPVYVSTYCTSKTTLVIGDGFTIYVTNEPTQIITSGTATKTVTYTNVVTQTV